VAHVYGRRFSIEPYLHFASKHGIPLLEDCAEAFQGLQYTGDPRADMSFFSFGTIKHATAFGGAICVVKDQEEATKMRFYSCPCIAPS
jgi:dTDP-4-amino-4,6-dideoxygalactose transaminase